MNEDVFLVAYILGGMVAVGMCAYFNRDEIDGEFLAGSAIAFVAWPFLLPILIGHRLGIKARTASVDRSPKGGDGEAGSIADGGEI